MLPEATSDDLLYVSESYLYLTGVGYRVHVYSYPDGMLVGTLHGFDGSGGECVDRKGDVFITDWHPRTSIAEFAHGGSRPIRTLKDSGAHISCSVDPATGNLAVANGGNVAVFVGARGKPALYTDPSFKSFWFCGYDDKGNLFVDGLGNSRYFAFAELPKGAKSFTDITLNYGLGHPGSVQAAHGEVAIADGAAAVYRFKISGSAGSLVGTTKLDQLFDGSLQTFWIHNSTVAVAWCCPSAGTGALLFPYPAGGYSTQYIATGGHPFGTAISLAPRRQ